jgi:hypothetical protein
MVAHPGRYHRLRFEYHLRRLLALASRQPEEMPFTLRGIRRIDKSWESCYGVLLITGLLMIFTADCLSPPLAFDCPRLIFYSVITAPSYTHLL